MKCSVLLIFCIISCFGMEEYSRLEQLPSNIKINIIKEVIRNAQSREQAVKAVRTWIIGDRLFRKNNGYIIYGKTIEDHLGWHWNDERPFSLWPKKVFIKTNLPQITDPELCKAQQGFAHFCQLLNERKAVPNEILTAIDLYHCYITQEPYQDTRLGATFIRERTPLYVATAANDQATVERLLQLGCDTQKLSHVDMNPLHLASKKNYQGIVALLIKYKAPLNAQTKRELKTAMHFAAEEGHMDIMHMLASAGADRTIKDKLSYTPDESMKKIYQNAFL